MEYCLCLANGYILARLGVEVMVPSPVGDLKSVPLISTFLALSLAENLNHDSPAPVLFPALCVS